MRKNGRREVRQERKRKRTRVARSVCGACGAVTGFIKVQSAGLKNNRRT